MISVSASSSDRSPVGSIAAWPISGRPQRRSASSGRLPASSIAANRNRGSTQQRLHVIRPSTGRLYCGFLCGVFAPLSYQVTLPSAGPLHCGGGKRIPVRFLRIASFGHLPVGSVATAPGTAGHRGPRTSPGRPTAGSIAATTGTCSVGTSTRSSGRSSAGSIAASFRTTAWQPDPGHPSVHRPAPLRLVAVQHGGCLAQDHPAGSTAASTPGIWVCTSTRHPTDHRSSAGSIAASRSTSPARATRLLIRPTNGRLH